MHDIAEDMRYFQILEEISVTQAMQERHRPISRQPGVESEIPSAEIFVRLINKLAEASRRESERLDAEMRVNQVRVRRGRVRVRVSGRDRDDALYIISIAARLAEMHPQTLRKYDREGLVSPSRTEGSRRLYSEEDLDRLQVVRRLSEDLGLNLNGVGLVLELVQQMQGMLQVIESSEDLSGSHAARAVAEQIKAILQYLGVN